MNFLRKLDKTIHKNNSLLCIGLDPQIEKLPEQFKKEKYPLFAFNKSIIEQTFDLVSCYKPNTAFYESQGSHGIMQLKLTCDLLRSSYTHIPIILDAKRGDIGNTNKGYVAFAFDYLGADAITLHPFSGKEGMKEFLDQKDKGCIVWCKGSNPGSGEFQDLRIDGRPLYELIAKNVVNDWNYNKNCLLVVGATYPEQLHEIRKIVGDEITLLVPGIGVQGGSVKAAVEQGKNLQSKGLIISTSRSILYASSGEDFQEAARKEAVKLRDEINGFR